MPITIYPYRYEDEDIWVFDDEKTGLKEEAFIRGASEMISRIVEAKHIPDADRGFALTFSDEPFEGQDAVLEWLRTEVPGVSTSGNWYAGTIAGQEMKCWLCAALFCFFETAPARLHVKADPLPTGVDPFWRDPDGMGRRFVGPNDE